jgi:hypothetical protein
MYDIGTGGGTGGGSGSGGEGWAAASAVTRLIAAFGVRST